jgi:alpha-tubulin suppressor-like RCC1 family protein
VAGEGHACAITAIGGVKCWGWGHEWQLGNGSMGDQASPVDVSGLSGVVGLAAGATFTCALKAAGTVACWGDGSTGVTGPTAPFASSLTPVTVTGLTHIVALSAGRYHVCALKDDGSVACWGSNESWQLGWGVSAAMTFTPTVVAGLAGVVAIASGNSFNCAIKADTTVACWGNDASGQLGVAAGTPIPNGQPMVVQSAFGGPLSDVLSLSLGSDHACAIAYTGSVTPGGGYATLCWGNNANSQSGASGVEHNIATPVPGQTGVLMLSTGHFSSCSQDADFAFRCWGSNSYGESDATGAAAHDVVQPTLLPGLQGAEAPDFAAGGNEYLCALIDDGTARCVGRGGNGQLGNGVAADAKTLQTVNAPSGTFWNWAGNAPR